ncbi:MAG: fumarylacetoacetate hydrolase family protein [Alphaproteobacteria bacterium]|nr:fumarylacetoacetate hydrolase family protein [Alphaproteobacteria bacterium]
MDEAARQAIAEQLAGLIGTGRQVAPISQRFRGFDLVAGYDVVHRVQKLREAAGENPVGRKVGFTNRNIWDTFSISAPVWNFVFDRTVHEMAAPLAVVDISKFCEPLIEPELVLHLGETPKPGMNEAELAGCVDWVAPGFEIVHSIFPGWEFSAADAAAAYGMHGALFIGPKCRLSADGSAAGAPISGFEVTLRSDAGEARRGSSSDILGGPLKVLSYIVEEIARYPGSAPLRQGEVVTTGTLTDAMPAKPGETWRASFEGIELAPIALRLGQA